MSDLWSKDGYREIAKIVRLESGLTFPVNRRPSAERAINIAMHAVSVADLCDYKKLLLANRAYLNSLIDDLVVGETYFFREPERLNYLRSVILPELLSKKKANCQLRLWSAGCASGEEPYTLAILLREYGLREHFQILGTDICRKALSRAEEGSYSKWSFRGTDESLIEKYFRACGEQWILDREIRRHVRLSKHNLAADARPAAAQDTGSMDIILCRNVLIYFDRDTIARVARLFFDSLAPGGWLMTGASDPCLREFAPFQSINSEAGTFYKRQPEQSATGDRIAGNWFPTAQSIRQATLSGEHDRSKIPRLQSQATPHSSSPSGAGSEKGLAEQAESEFSQGNWQKVVDLLGSVGASTKLNLLYVQALSNLDLRSQAEKAVASALCLDPLSAEINLLAALLLLRQKKHSECLQALKKVIYLDRSLVVAHFTQALVLRLLGDEAGALKAYRNARNLCSALPPAAEIPFAGGACAENLSLSANRCIEQIESRSHAVV